MKLTIKTAYKLLCFSLLCITIFFFTGCQSKIQNYSNLPISKDYIEIEKEQKRELKLGVVSGPYGDMFMNTMEPILQEKGYSVELVIYDSFSKPNFALMNGEIDLNLFQNYKYLNNFKAEYDASLTAVTEVPTLAMSLFSNKFDNIEDISVGSTIAIPNDFTNLSRSLKFLEYTGLIKLEADIDKSKATVENIVLNPLQLNFVEIEAADAVKSLSTQDAVVINGNYAVSGGLDLSQALSVEELSEKYMNVIVVRTEDLGQDFVTAIIECTHSQKYKEFFMEFDSEYHDFQLPATFYDDTVRENED